MPAFNIGSSIEQLDWDFTGRKPDGTFFPDWPSELAHAKGTLRDPSDKMIGDFLDGMKTIYKDAAKITGLAEEDDPSPEQVLELLDEVSGDDFVKLMHETSVLYATLCSNAPSLEQIELLPMRGRSAFFIWIMQEVVRPEAGSNGGAQVVNLRPTAATG